MEKDRLFKKYYNKLAAEGILKSFLWGATVAFSATFVAAFICWFTTDIGLWVSLGVLFGVHAAAVPAFYFFRFKPTAKEIAKRIDSLGLEERVITMQELEKDSSYIAMRQREDALAALKRTEPSKMNMCVSTISAVLVGISGVLGSGMTVVTALAANGTVPGGPGILDPVLPPDEEYYQVRYVVLGLSTESDTPVDWDAVLSGELDIEDVMDEGGVIEGEADQIVVAGGDATPVFATPEEDWYFVCWDFDEKMTDPYRWDTAITADGAEINEDGQKVITHYALFDLIGESKPGDDDNDGDDSAQEEDAPPPEEKPEETERPKPDDDNPNDNEDNKDEDDKDQTGTEVPDKDMTIDGEQDYRKRYEEYYQQAQEFINRGEEVPQYLKDLIDYYYNIIK